MTRIEPFASRWLPVAVLFLFLGVGDAMGADTRPVVGPGATKDEAINAYGWPTGQSQLGAKEVLTYPQGTITLVNGKVERVDFSPNVPWGPPRPRPGPASATGKKARAVPQDFWTTSLADAMAEAQERQVKILAAFTGSDWSPPSKRFLDEVATNTDFLNALTGDFVFLKVDFPTRTALPADVKKQNDDLRARCAVTTYPALLVLSAQGAPVGIADLAKERAGNYREQITEAVVELRDLLKVRAQVAAEPKTTAGTGGAAAAPASTSAPVASASAAENKPENAPVAAAMSRATMVVLIGLAGGAVLAALFVWWIWRSRVQLSTHSKQGPKFAGPAVRLADVPTPTELAAWPVEQLRKLVAAHFGATGYRTNLRDHGSELTIELTRPGHPKPGVLVCCLPGREVVSAKAVREFFGTLVSSGIDAGWVVSAGDFAADAHQLAAERGLELIDGPGLISRLNALDPLIRERVLSQAGA